MTVLMVPAIELVTYPRPFPTAQAVIDCFEPPSKSGVFAIPSAVCGNPEQRMDAECILLETGERFSVEATREWMRVWYGKLQPLDEEVQAINNVACKRIAGIVANLTGEQP